MNIDELYLDFLNRIVDRTVGENDAIVLQMAMAKRNLELHEESVRAQFDHYAWAVTAQERQTIALESLAYWVTVGVKQGGLREVEALERIAKALEIAGSL